MKLRLSFSTVSMWRNGDVDGAIDALMGKYREPTDAMKFGSFMHKQWEQEVNNTQCLPTLFGGARINEPKTEQYYCVQLDDWLWLCGVIDLEYKTDDGRTILVDYKTGNSNANHYSNSLQAGCYKILRPNAELFVFKHFNQYTENVTSSIVHLTNTLEAHTMQKIISTAYEMAYELDKRGMPDFDNYERKPKNETK